MLFPECVVALNRAIATCFDAHATYARLAGWMQRLHHPDLAAFINSEAAHRYRLATRLQEQVRQLGHLPESHGETPPSAHVLATAWKRLHESAREAVLDTYARQEAAILEQLTSAQRYDLPKHTQHVLQQCRHEIYAAHHRARALGAPL